MHNLDEYFLFDGSQKRRRREKNIYKYNSIGPIKELTLTYPFDSNIGKNSYKVVIYN